jgi:hypothetical protein
MTERHQPRTEAHRSEMVGTVALSPCLISMSSPQPWKMEDSAKIHFKLHLEDVIPSTLSPTRHQAVQA